MKIYVIMMILFTLACAGLRWAGNAQMREVVSPRFCAGSAIMLLAGFLLHSILLMLIVCTVVSAVTARNRTDALVQFLLYYVLLPDIRYEWSVGSTYLFTVFLHHAFTLAFLINLQRFPADQPARRGMSAEDAVMAFLIFMFAVAWTRFPSVTIAGRQIVDTVINLVIPYLALRSTIRTEGSLQRLILAIVAAAVILSVYTAYEYRFGWVLFGQITGNFEYATSFNANLSIRNGALRASASFLNPLALASFLSLAVLGAGVSRRDFNGTVPWIGTCLVILYGLYTTQSRGNTVMLGLGILILLLTRRQIGTAAALMATGLAAYAASATMSVGGRDAALFGTDTRVVYAGKVYSDYRGLLLDRGVDEIRKHPLTGQTFEDTLASLQDIKQGEKIVDLVNFYLNVALVSGLPGLLIFVTGLAMVLLRLITGNPAAGRMNAYRGFVLASFATYLAQLAFMSFISRMPLLMMLLLASARAVSLAPQARRERIVPPVAPDPLPA
ncbi:O-antigen ligase family protein [Sphingomonas sp. ID0503]|uniref:O-antigen ligase family protein n=1 Tax=Sphingomonas sp. ID0503 TaxID=3399691 RepID=UPI003AFAB164